MLCSVPSSIFVLFSAKNTFAEIKERKLRNRNLPKIGCCLPTSFFLFCFSFPVVWSFVFFLFICVQFFCLEKAPTKRLFSCNFRVFFFYFVPAKGLSLKSLFASYSVFFPCFPFVFPFKIPSSFFVFCPSAPFWNFFFLGGGGFLCLSFLVAFSFVSVCLLHWTKLS